VSSINELAAVLCPNGVPFARLGDVAILDRGRSITKAQTNAGAVPVIAGGRSPAYYHDQSNRAGETIVVAGSGAYAGFVSWWDQPIWVSDAFSVVSNSETLLNRYCYHFLLSRQETIHQFQSSGGVPHVYPKHVAELQIPIPPVEVQSEVVRVLDKFTTLEAELEAELEARSVQFEHYRRTLIDKLPAAGCGMKPLGDVVQFSKGRSLPTEARLPGPYPVVSAGRTAAFHHADFTHNGPAVTVASHGDAGFVNYWSSSIWLGNNVFLLTPTSEMRSDFLYHLLKVGERQLQSRARGGGVPYFNARDITDLQISVPPLEEQEKIAQTLNAMNAIVNDLSSGLPAEIAARRKQYEHYRERLLTFKELEA
jgi:type I restriction enzyme S subunit